MPKIVKKNLNKEEIIEETAEFNFNFLEKIEEGKKEAKRIRENEDAKEPCVGVFWVKPKNTTPENDAWELTYSLSTPISLASKIDEVVATAQDHLSIWNSLKKIDPQRFAGQYEETPRGRILYNKGIFIVLVGNFACKTDQEFSGSKDISKDIKPNIKRMIEQEYNLVNPIWMHDLHYNIKGMTPESDDFEDDEDWEDFDEKDSWEDDEE